MQSDVASGTVTLDHAVHDGLALHTALRAYDDRLDRNYTTIGAASCGAVERHHGPPSWLVAALSLPAAPRRWPVLRA